tara:strand:- start:799 stop:1581 length:783 start_codon:yes stop_codon:yes gene_type:complete
MLLLNNNKPVLKKKRVGNRILNLITIRSKQTNKKTKVVDNIYLFTQFYIPNNNERYEEIKETLKLNVMNESISEIYLLNDREYTEEEMGIKNDKIIQIVKNRRMTFSDSIIESLNNNLKGYIIITNSDIFFNKTLKNIFISGLVNEKKVFSLLRTEYEKDNIANKKLYKDYEWSADTWIFHSNNIKNIVNIDDFNLTMGIGSVDNIIPYKFLKNGFEIYNEPLFIETLHNHHNNYRTWKKNNLFKGENNYLSCLPNLTNR